MPRSPSGGRRAPAQAAPRPHSPRRPSEAQRWHRFTQFQGEVVDLNAPITSLGYRLAELPGRPARKGV